MAHILIANDDADSRELLRFFLSSLGHEVTSAHDGAEALACARKYPPDLIISDRLMPVMDGFDLCREVQRVEKLHEIPFIFYTATYVSAEDEQLAMNLGGSGFIRKADEAATLSAMLENVLRQNLGKKIPPLLLREGAWSELETRHEKIVTRKLAKKSAELRSERVAHQESVELLSAVFDSALSGILAMDSAGKIIVWNRAASRMFGYEASEVLGNDLHAQIVPESYHEKARVGMQHFFATGEGPLVGKMIDLTGMRKDKSTFPVSLSVVSFRRNNAWYAAATIRDISERKQADEALRDSEERLRLALDAAHMGTFDWDVPHNHITWSRWLEELWGFKPGEFGGTYETFAQRVHPDDVPGINAEVARYTAARQPFMREFRVIWPDASTHWIFAQGEFTFATDGQPVQMRGAVVEITERKLAEAELLKLSQAVEQNPNSIVIANRDANIEYVNDAFVKMTGYSRDEVIGKNPRILQSGKTPKAVHEDIWVHLNRGESWRGEMINKRKGGSEYIESVLISPVRQADGRVTHYLAIEEDITEKKKAEERIERLAHFDQLTGLPNRILMGDRFKYALSLAQRSDEPLAVMFLDLDHFKDINDTLGHTIGDQLLMEVARRIKATLREEDTVSRQGGR